MHLKLAKDITWIDLPRIEAPATARAWVEGNLSAYGDSSLWLPGLTEFRESEGIPVFDAWGDATIRDLLLERIEACEVFVVNDLQGEPAIPLLRRDPDNEEHWIIAEHLGTVAQTNVEEVIRRALSELGTLAPAPVLAAQSPPAPREQASPAQRGRVALVPVRYGVTPRYEQSQYRYSHPNLAADLPPLERARYVLRTLRSGFLYVYFQGHLAWFNVSAAGKFRRGDRGEVAIKASGDALIFHVDSDEEEVLLAFSDHEWTENQRRKMERNEGYRAHQMQRFSLGAPGPDAIPVLELAREVEEYAGRADDYEWSEYRAPNRDAGARMSSLNSMAATKQVVALYDPAGLTHELGAFIERELNSLHDYIKTPDRDSPAFHVENYRKKVIAEAIEGIYTQRFAQHYYKKNQAENWAYDDKASHEFKQTQKEIEAAQEELKEARDDFDRHAGIPGSARRLQEAERRLEALKARSQQLIAEGDGPRTAEQALDASAQGRRLGPAFRSVPVKELRRNILTEHHMNPDIGRLTKHVDEEARRGFLRAYDRVVDSFQKNILAYKKDRHAWLSTWDRTDNPKYLGTVWATYDLSPDSAGDWNVQKEQWLHYENSFAASTRGAVTTLCSAKEEPENKLWAKWLSMPIDDSPLHRALLGTKELRRVIAPADVGSLTSAIEKVYQQIPISVATEEIMQSTVTHAIISAPQWKGAVSDSIEARIARYLEMSTADASTFVRWLQGRYGVQVVKRAVSVEKITRSLITFGATGNRIEWIQRVSESGTLRGSGIKLYHFIDLTKRTSRRQIHEALPESVSGFGTAGISAFVGLLSIINLWMVAEQFKAAKAENWAGLAAGFFGMAEAIATSMNKFSKHFPSSPVGRAANGGIGRWLAREGTGKALGKITGVAGAVFMAIKAGDRVTQGDTDAAMYYSASGLLGVAAAFAPGGPLGAIAAVVLIGVSIWMGWEAEKAVDTELEKWLDSSTFGRHELGGRRYPNLKAEVYAMAMAIYGPKREDDDWNPAWFGSENEAELRFFLPGYDPNGSTLSISANGRRVEPGKGEPAGGGYRFKVLYKTDEDHVTFRVKYRPSLAFKDGLTLAVRLGEQRDSPAYYGRTFRRSTQ